MSGAHQLGASVGVRGPDDYITRPLTAAEKGEQDEQVWRAERIRARRDAEAAEAARAEWMARLRKTGRV